jgi:hypothetical protein
MKRNYTLLLFLLATVSILAQTPEKMSYQLVLRDASNTLLTNQLVGIQISILQTTNTGSAVYTETQTATTNINGLVSLEIGTGASSNDFSAIDWSAGPYFIKTATDANGGSNYSIIGTSQLMSVPYALYAKTSGSSTPGLQGEPGIQGDQGEPGIQGPPGADGATGSYVDLTTDQTIGGTKTFSKDLIVNGLLIGKGAGTGSGIAIGNGALPVSTANGNIAVGASALAVNTSGYTNIAVGWSALTKNKGGVDNIAIGTQALYRSESGHYNVVIGQEAMAYNTSGIQNTAVGMATMSTNTIGGQNTALGYNANVGADNLTNATVIGNQAIVDASNKVQIGNNAVNAVQLGTGSNVTLQTGLVKITGGTPGVGKVLTSDATGLASWADAATGTDNQTAAEVPSNLTGNIEATNVDAAIAELEAEKAPLASPTFTGSIITPALQVTGGSPEAGKVLTSDADGLASWEEAPGGQSSGTTTGDMQYWNGTAWVVVAATPNEGAALQMISGVPTWVGGALPATVGDLRAGGVVFWVDPADNTHGLVCALSDDANLVEWGCYNLDLPNVPNVPYNGGNPVGLGAEIGDGESNTNSILADCSSAPAALAARSFGSEWFLPSINELNQMYIHKTTLEAVAGFSAFSNDYWSSTEFDYYDSAWEQNFVVGYRDNFNKFNTRAVRAVRAF